MEDSLVWVGRVVKAQGRKGQVRVHSSADQTSDFPIGDVIFLENQHGEKKPFTIASFRHGRQVSILSFREVKGVEEAGKLVGCSVYVPKENLRVLPPGEYYQYQLLGMQVQTEKGIFLGMLEEILPTGSNDVFVVRREGEEILIPATEEVVLQVDLKGKIMVIRPLEGLLPEHDI